MKTRTCTWYLNSLICCSHCTDTRCSGWGWVSKTTFVEQILNCPVLLFQLFLTSNSTSCSVEWYRGLHSTWEEVVGHWQKGSLLLVVWLEQFQSKRSGAALSWWSWKGAKGVRLTWIILSSKLGFRHNNFSFSKFFSVNSIVIVKYTYFWYVYIFSLCIFFIVIFHQHLHEFSRKNSQFACCMI